LRFPERCIFCGATPAGKIAIEVVRGLDVLVLAVRRRVAIEAPVCGSCGGRHGRRRVLWWAGIVAAIVLPLLALAAWSAEQGYREPPPAVYAPFLAWLLPLLWLSRNRELDLYHRWFTPVCIRRWKPGLSVLTVGFRDDAMASEVRRLTDPNAPES
jgi:hypothetical protein